MDFHIRISASSMLDSRLYIIYIANYILLLGRPLLFQKHFCLFFQKFFKTCFSCKMLAYEFGVLASKRRP